MAESKVQYIVEVSKAGTGGQQAAAELNAAAGAANLLNRASAATNAGLVNLQTTTKTTGVLFKSLSGVIHVAGLQTFPQLTAAAMVTQQALNAVRNSGVALTANLATVGAGVAGLAAAVVSAAFAWRAYQAEQQAAASQAAAAEAAQANAERLRATLKELRAEGTITVETFDELNRALRGGSEAGNQRVRDYLRALERGTAGERIAAFHREFANEMARRQNLQPESFDVTGDLDRLGFRMNLARGLAQDEYNRKLELYNELIGEGLITEEQRAALSQEADTARLQRLTQINAQVEATKIKLVALREVEREAMTDFAGGLARTLVDVRAWVKDAGAAFAQFFAQLAQSIAEAIAQMLILRALQSAFPSFFAAAAEGGVFPRRMALGGVQTVSSATYFPRFNVVAGEAGSEMMAVLSRPRLMNVGGIEAAVGNAQGHRLALTSADALARGAAGGHVNITVSLEPGLRASIVQDSVSGAVVRVTQDAGRSTPLREAIRKVQ